MPKAKKSNSKGRAQRSAIPDKLPRRAAGTPAPRRIRKETSWRSLLSSELGRELIASALVAAAVAIVGDERGKARAKRSQARRRPSPIAVVVADAAIDMVGRGLAGPEEERPEPAQGTRPDTGKAGRRARKKSPADVPSAVS